MSSFASSSLIAKLPPLDARAERRAGLHAWIHQINRDSPSEAARTTAALAQVDATAYYTLSVLRGKVLIWIKSSMSRHRQLPGRRPPGYRLNALVSPLHNASWRKLAVEFLRAEYDGDTLKVFTNTIRGGHYGQRSCEPHLKAEHMAQKDMPPWSLHVCYRGRSGNICSFDPSAT